MSFISRRFVRIVGSISLAGALIAGATIVQADDASAAVWNITVNGSEAPSFPLGQVNIALHIADSSSNPATGGQASLTEGSKLLATTNVTSTGDAVFAPSAFGDDYNFLQAGNHSVVAHYEDDSHAFTVNITKGAVSSGVDSVTAITSTTATFNYHVTQVGYSPAWVFPTGIVSLTENGNVVATQAVALQKRPSLTVTGSFAGIKLDASPNIYQVLFQGDQNFASSSSAPWSTAAFVPTHITWATLPSGQSGQTFDGTVVNATITADQYTTLVAGTVRLYEGTNNVATATVGTNGAISFSYLPTVGSHQFKIHYDGAGAYLGSDSDAQLSTYAVAPTTTTTTTLPTTPTTTPSGTTTATGYRLVGADGAVISYGVAGYGDFAGHHLNAAIIAAVHTTTDRGYWLIGADGGIFTFGDAKFFDSMGGKPLNKPIVGMAPTPSGNGYWLVASDGGVFAFGDAKFYGSMGGKPLNKPVVGITAAKDGNGYRLVASDGGVFSFGSAKFWGSMGGSSLNKPIVGMEATASGDGYWMVASDGGIFAFGDAEFHGSTGSTPLNKPIVGMRAAADGNGYWFVASDGGVFNFGSAGFQGSAAGNKLSAPIVAMA